MRSTSATAPRATPLELSLCLATAITRAAMVWALPRPVDGLFVALAVVTSWRGSSALPTTHDAEASSRDVAAATARRAELERRWGVGRHTRFQQ